MNWQCVNCGMKVESDSEPSSRFEEVSSHHLGGNTYEGIENTDYQKSASHYGPVCFGPDRGEDYQQHDWKQI